MTIEKTVLSNLIFNEEYSRKVLPFLKEDYFSGAEKTVFNIIDSFVKDYNALPTKEAILLDLDKVDISDFDLNEANVLVKEFKPENTELEWLLDNTEKFCQDKAIYNAVYGVIDILGDDKKKTEKGGIPKLLADAIAVSFDSHIGHDFLEDVDERFDFYHRKESRISFDLDYLNKITRGGLPNKTLSVILAGTNVGKSLAMCHMAAHNLSDSKNVLYITMEMAEERIAERIDANLMNMPINDVETLPKEAYETKVNRIKEKTNGRFIIKEYPTASAGAGHFRHLLNELKIKKNFIPDIIYIDYLNICMSSRIRFGSGVNSYSYIKAIAEELRGLAVEFNLPIVTATQTNREGFNSSDVDLTNTSESFGLPATADFMIAMISTEELEELNQILFKQLKNRFSDVTTNKRFVIGVDRSRMKLYDVEQNAQDDIMDDDVPLFDKSAFGQEMSKRGDTKKINFDEINF